MLVMLSVLFGLVFPLVNLLFVFSLFDQYLSRPIDPQTAEKIRHLVFHPNLAFAIVGTFLTAIVILFWRRNRQADRELKISEARLTHILDSTPAGILIVDRQTEKIVAANPAAGTMIGIEPSRLCGLFVGCLFESVDSSTNTSPLNLMQDASGECRLWTTKNCSLPVWGSARDLQFGDTHQRIISFVDLSALKEAELAVSRAERLAAVGTLTAGIAHEFNNTHQIALSYSELALRREEVDPGLQKTLEGIHGALGRARNISKQLLVFSGPQTGKIREENLADVLEGVLSLTRRELESTGVRLETDLQSVPAVLMDAGQIGQVALNLLINAQHALLDRPEQVITVRTWEDPEGVAFSITDTGCGIPAGEEARIFSPFYSTKGEFAEKGSAQAKIKGTGLGLSVSQAIIKNHGGSIQVNSTPDRGTSFTVRLPLTRPVAEDLPVKEPSVKEPVLPLSKQPETILVLDDEAEVREVLRQFLDMKGFRVLDTSQGSEALDWLQRESIDLALVDLQMPGMNGYNFLHRLGNLPDDRRPAALVLTGTLGAEAILEKEGLAWAGVIHKPFQLHEIEERLHVALETGSRTTKPVPVQKETTGAWALPQISGTPFNPVSSEN